MRSEATINRSPPRSYSSRTLPECSSGRVDVTARQDISQVVREVGQDLVAVLGDEHEILQTAAAEAAPIAPRLDRDDVAGDEIIAYPAHVRPLVDLQADPVPEPVEVPVLEHRVGLLGQLRRLARLDVRLGRA